MDFALLGEHLRGAEEEAHEQALLVGDVARAVLDAAAGVREHEDHAVELARRRQPVERRIASKNR